MPVTCHRTATTVVLLALAQVGAVGAVGAVGEEADCILSLVLHSHCRESSCCHCCLCLQQQTDYYCKI